jgi:hypothetical protein
MDYYIPQLYRKLYKLYLNKDIDLFIYVDYNDNQYDYDKIKYHRMDLNKEIIEWYYKPDNIDKWIHEINE